jgi:hypothetical protein
VAGLGRRPPPTILAHAAAVVAELRKASSSKDGPMKLIRARVNISLDLTPSHSIVSDDTVIILGNSFRSQSSCRLALHRREGDMLSQWPQPSCGMNPLLARQWSRRPIWEIQDHRHSHYRDRRQSDRGSRAADTAIRDAGAERGWHPLRC